MSSINISILVALFLVMQAVIQPSEKVPAEDVLGNLVDFVHVKHERKLERGQRKPKKPQPPDEPLHNLPPQNFNVLIDNIGFSMHKIDINLKPDISGGGFDISDGDFLPIVKVQTQYPRREISMHTAVNKP